MKFDAQNKADIGKGKILLNGVKVPRCYFADEEAGYIERWETDGDGHVIATRDADGSDPRPISIREYGVVKIVRGGL